MEDFVRLQKDYSDVSPDALVREYLTITEEGLDPEDIESLMEDFEYDEEVDDESVVKKTKLAKKKLLLKQNDSLRNSRININCHLSQGVTNLLKQKNTKLISNM